MPNAVPTMMIITVSKLILWLAVITTGTILLRRRKMSTRLRLAFVVGGTITFGFIYGFLLPVGQDPNPVLSLRGVIAGIVGVTPLVPVSILMLAVLLITVFVSNKSICGWGCPLGLLQDLLNRVPLPKWRPPFWLSNGIRISAFVVLVGGIALAHVDWISYVDPFRLFHLSPVPTIVGFSLLVVTASLFVYRPWCQFLCPFGFVGWIVEQVSLMHPRVDRDKCKSCRLCVKACPTGAMKSFLDQETIHPDCFACGACIEACRIGGALHWG
jgi:polyferredoxin